MNNELDKEIEALRKELQERPDDVQLDSLLGPAPAAPVASDTALRHDRWSRRRGKEWADSDVGKAATKSVEHDKERHSLGADMLSAAWDPCPQLVEGDCQCDGRRQFLRNLMESPEYKSIHRDTSLDVMASELAAASFAKQWIDYFEERSNSGDPDPGGESDEDDVEAQARMQRHTRNACKEAKESVKDLKETRESLGIGGDGGTDGTMSIDEIKQQFARIKKNQTLRRIMELSGKYLRLAKSIQSSKHVHGQDEVVGIEFSRDLSRVLPSELALLADESTELEFMRKFAEGSLMSRETRSVEDEAKGPIVVVVDESGSMRGERVANAKAMALAFLWIARHQKRWACLVGFSGGATGNFLTIPPGANDTPELINWLAHFFGGGTTLDVPLDVLPSHWAKLGCPAGRTDIIQITDAVVNVRDDMAAKFNAWKQSNEVKMSTIVVNHDKGDLGLVSDSIWTVDQLDIESQAVRDCLSV